MLFDYPTQTLPSPVQAEICWNSIGIATSGVKTSKLVWSVFALLCNYMDGDTVLQPLWKQCADARLIGWWVISFGRQHSFQVRNIYNGRSGWIVLTKLERKRILEGIESSYVAIMSGMIKLAKLVKIEAMQQITLCLTFATKISVWTGKSGSSSYQWYCRR